MTSRIISFSLQIGTSEGLSVKGEFSNMSDIPIRAGKQNQIVSPYPPDDVTVDDRRTNSSARRYTIDRKVAVDEEGDTRRTIELPRSRTFLQWYGDTFWPTHHSLGSNLFLNVALVFCSLLLTLWTVGPMITGLSDQWHYGDQRVSLISVGDLNFTGFERGGHVYVNEDGNTIHSVYVSPSLPDTTVRTVILYQDGANIRVDVAGLPSFELVNRGNGKYQWAQVVQ